MSIIGRFSVHASPVPVIIVVRIWTSPPPKRHIVFHASSLPTPYQTRGMLDLLSSLTDKARTISAILLDMPKRGR